MGCHKFKFGESFGFITLADVYKYKGFTFEFHHYLGPVKLRKDGEPAKRQGRKFYKIVDEWEKLSKVERRKTQIYR